MEFIALLPILMFFIFIFMIFISIARGLKKISEKPQNPASSPKFPPARKKGWKDLLSDTVAQIQKEIKAAQERQKKLSRGKKPAPGAETPRRSTLVWDKNAPIPSPPPLPLKDSPEKKKRTPPSETKKTEPAVRKEEKIVEPVPMPKIETTTEELRKAVAWSEVLAPPLALRKEQDRFRDF